MTKIVNEDQNVNLIMAKETHEHDMFSTHNPDPRLGSVQ